MILMHTIQKNEGGISSLKLDEALWSDKFGDSARNNRNVNISKLRTILDELPGVEVVNENSFWKINLGSTVFCDYVAILDLLQKIRSTTLATTEIHELISLLSFGALVPTIQTEWMDGFRTRFGGETIDGLGALISQENVMDDLSLRYHVAECILVFDPLNDEAFSLKCSVLYHLGKKGMAKSLYDSFCHEYKQVLGIDYSVSFSDTIR
jgi:two-component SAPR family response regulator